MIAILTAAGIVLMLLGAFGVYLAMNSPLQLQPIPAIAFLAGVGMVVFGLGGIVL